MKQILFLGLIALSLFSCEKYHTRNTEISDFIRSEYYADARQIYYDEFSFNKFHKNYNEAEFDEKEIDHILKLIQLVYDSELPERDTIFSVYNIHKSCSGNFNTIILHVDTSNYAIKNLAKGITSNTSDRVLDNYLLEYEIDSVVRSMSYPKSNWLALYFKKAWNPIKTIDDFATVEGVEYCSGNEGCFDGDDIEVKIKAGKMEIDFSHGWGDCPSGCIRRIGWIFSVRNNQVKLLKRYEN
ncbi:MAG: hypothetical protein JXQ87_00450 [Bacteroidia bacterium]